MTIIVQYNMICTECGRKLDDGFWLESGVSCYRAAAALGWGTEGGNLHQCPDCRTPESWGLDGMNMPVVVMPSPPGYKPPMLRCSCGTKTLRRAGKCRGCGEEIQPYTIELANEELL